MRCEDVMTSEVEVLRVGETVREAARRMRELNIGFVPICDAGGALQGVLTDRDIALRVVAEGRPASTLVEDVMTEEVVTCRPEDDIRRAEELMRVNQKARIPCVDDAGHVVGVVSTTDLSQYEEVSRAAEVIGDITDREAGVH